jgi:hypothetical protein
MNKDQVDALANNPSDVDPNPAPLCLAASGTPFNNNRRFTGSTLPSKLTRAPGQFMTPSTVIAIESCSPSFSRWRWPSPS